MTEIEIPTGDSAQYTVVVGYSGEGGGYYVRIYNKHIREWNHRIHSMLEPGVDPLTEAALTGAILDEEIEDTIGEFGYQPAEKILALLSMVTVLDEETIDNIMKAKETLQ